MNYDQEAQRLAMDWVESEDRFHTKTARAEALSKYTSLPQLLADSAKVEELERYKLHMETACKVGTATEHQMLVNENEQLRARLKELEAELEAIKKISI